MKATNAAELDFSEYIAERTLHFTGREWLFREIDDWLDDPKAPQFFILTGDPGIGKSAIASRLKQFSDGIRPPQEYRHIKKDFISGLHFCSARRGSWISPESFARSLSAQLAARCPEFARSIASGLKLEVKQTIGLCLGTAVGVEIQNYHAESSEAVFNNLVRQPLNALCWMQPSADLILILVDGLDESLYYSGRPNIAGLLAACHDLSPKVRFLITSRNKEEVLRPFRPLEPYILYARKEENMADLSAYLRRRFQGSEKLRLLAGGDERVAEVIRSLTSRSGGNFLVVSKILSSMEHNEISIDDPQDLPSELKDLYAWFLDRLTRGDENRWRDLYRPVLGIMAAAFEPLDVSALSRWTGLSRQKVSDAIHDLREFMDSAMKGKNSSYRLYHQSVVDFLTEGDSGAYFIDSSEYHQKIAESYKDFLDGKVDWPRCDLYGLRYLPSHLTAAAEWKSLFQILTDFCFMEAKARSLSVYELEADFRNSLKSWEGEKEGRSILTAFEECLRLQAHHINRSPGLLFPHLYNHLVWLDAPGGGQAKCGPIFRICKDAEQKHSNWLKMAQDPRPAPPLWLRSFEGHTGWVSSVAVTAAGHVVSGSADRTIKIWDLASGRLLRSLEGH
ncbi:MAG TPA: hypothetical protein PKX20_07425, partial [Methanothrix soehngenii]|nr:hypothetical protein [Methanothrix soehngenii]